MIFVGALNVGSINLKFDQLLKTNQKVKINQNFDYKIHEYF